MKNNFFRKKVKLSDLEKVDTKGNKKYLPFKMQKTKIKNLKDRFFLNRSKDSVRYMVVALGVFALIVLSCTAINKVENQMSPGERQAVADSFFANSSLKENRDEVMQSSKAKTSDTDDEYFANYEMEKEKSRSEQIDILKEISENDESSTEEKKYAEHQITIITENMEKEMLLESMLVAKYGGEALVFIQDDRVNIIMCPDDKNFAEKEAEKIAQMSNTYTGIGYEKAVIVIKE